MSQGYRNIIITLSFGSFSQNSNGIEALFYHKFQAWTGSENVDRCMPVQVWIPASEAGSSVLISKAKEGELFDIDGDLDMGNNVDQYKNYTPYIAIRAHSIYVHTAHQFMNKVTLFGKALPLTKTDGTPLFDVRASTPDKNGKSVHHMKFGVEKISSKQLENGDWTKSESVFFDISGNADSSGKGKSSSLFPYLAGQHIMAVGSLSVSESKGKTYTTVFVGGLHDYLQGVLAHKKEKGEPRIEPVKVKGFTASTATSTQSDEDF